MLDLSAKSSEFAYNWVKRHIIPQPVGDGSLTWFVSAAVLYRDYADGSMKAGEPPLSFNELYGVLRIFHSGLGTGRMRGVPIYTGLKYLRDGVQVFGV